MTADDSRNKADSEQSKPARPDSGRFASNDTADAAATRQEIGGRGGLDPTRYGDWEKAGRCVDF